MDLIFKLYFFIDFSYLFALLSIYVFHKLKIDKYLHYKIITSSKILIAIKVLGKITWGIGVSIVGGVILPMASFVVIYETGFWLGILFITIGVLMEEKSRKYLGIKG